MTEYVVWWKDRYIYGGTVTERVEAETPESAASTAVRRRYTDVHSDTGIDYVEVSVARIELDNVDVSVPISET